MRFFLPALILCSPLPVYAQDNSAQEPLRPRAVAVQSLTLQEVGPWGAAAIPDGITALPSDLWRGADPGTLDAVFKKLSPDQRFPSLQTLVRQALFSGGASPTNDPDIAVGRFEAANRFGPADAAAKLIFAVPRLSSEPNLASIAIDAGLRVGRQDEACSLVESVPPPPQGTTWLESRAVCYALNDEAPAANLTVDLAKSRGLTDTWLSRAIASASGPVTAPPPFRADSGRALALSLRAKLKTPTNLASLTDPLALSALIGQTDFMASLAPEDRLLLVRGAGSRGVIAPQILASHALPIDPTAPIIPAPERMRSNIQNAPSLSLRALEARAIATELRTTIANQPGSTTIADIPFLVEAALWSGDGALANSIANLSPEPLDARLGLILALFDPARQSQGVSARLDMAGNDAPARRLAQRDVLVAWSAGVPATQGVAFLVQTGLPWAQAGNAGIRAALDLAALRGSKGEVALLVGLALQGVDPNNADAETVVNAIQALRRVGLPDAARDLARDYLMASYVTLPSRPTGRPRPPTNIAPVQAATPPLPKPPIAPPLAPTNPAPTRAADPLATQKAKPVSTSPPLTPRPTAAPTLAPPPGGATRPQPSLARPAAPRTVTPLQAAPPPPRPTARPKPNWGTP